MDQETAQPIEQTEETEMEASPPEIPVDPPIKKFIPFIAAFIVLIIVFLFLLMFSAGKKGSQTGVPTPTLRPTATPFLAPTIPEVSPPAATQSSTISVTPKPEKIGRLAFIRDGDIYNSDLASFTLLVKNTIPAGDKLSWSFKGNFLSWRVASQNTTPSSLMVYDRMKQRSQIFKDKSEFVELVDYTWAPDESMLAILFRDESYKIVLFSPESASPSGFLLKRTVPIKQLIWQDKDTLLYLGSDGIGSILVSEQSTQMLVSTSSAYFMKLSPDHKKLLYTLGDNKKSNLYLLNLDNGSNRLINPVPQKVDMGTTKISSSTLNNGFLSYAVFMPKSDNLLVGYHFLQYIPLVGIYNLKENSFSAVAPFQLASSDVMVDELRLMGARVVNIKELPSWQISLFTLEDDAKLSLIRVIPNASSPTFFGDDVLPTGNTF